MAKTGTNICGECTVCCYLFPVRWLEKGPNEQCVHCDAGCQIHETKPKECSDFDCAWLQSSAPIEMRPDKCGIVFEKLSDRLFYGTAHKPVTADGRKQVHAFLDQGFSVILVSNTGGSSRTFIHHSHDEGEIKREFDECVGARCGSLRH